MTRPLSLEELAKLQSVPAKAPATKTPKIDLSVRTHEMWWKLATFAVECTVPNHNEEEADRKRMCVDIEGVQVCRYCYLNSLDRS